MTFTYDWYKRMLYMLSEHGYECVNYNNWRSAKSEKIVILRHDIDNDISHALKLAQIESEISKDIVYGGGAFSSTYFVLLSSDFYNIFSNRNLCCLNALSEMGHEIGLHFDEQNYPDIIGNVNAIKERILFECGILSNVLGKKISVVSMHRPSKQILDSDLKIDGITNSYGKLFFKDFKYISDSRHNWREPVEEIIASEKFKKLHILTHAFWYHENDESISQTVKRFVNSANKERYENYSGNISNLQEIMGEREVL